MSDPFGLGKFADCEHKWLKCEQCGAVSNIRGWQAFSDYDSMKDRIERLRAAMREIADFADVEDDDCDLDDIAISSIAIAKMALHDTAAEAAGGEE